MGNSTPMGDYRCDVEDDADQAWSVNNETGYLLLNRDDREVWICIGIRDDRPGGYLDQDFFLSPGFARAMAAELVALADAIEAQEAGR